MTRRLVPPIPVQQLANQLVFLAAGKVFYRLSVTWVEIGAILLVSVALEHAFIFARERRISALSTAAISSGFNLAFMLSATRFEVYAIALVVGLGQKHLFKAWAGRHFLNPSNAALVFALLVFPRSTTVTFTDWGQTQPFAAVIAVLGTLLLLRVRLAYLPYVFLIAYTMFSGLVETRNPHEIWMELTSAGFLLYAFFMVTDPKAVPASRGFIALHGILTALFAVGLHAVLGPKEVNPFLALVMSEFFVPLWRRLEVAPAVGRRLAYAGGGVAAAAALLYASPYNSLRNVTMAAAQPPAPALMREAAEAMQAPAIQSVGAGSPDASGPAAAAALGKRDEELFPARWSAAHVVSRTFREPANAPARRFERRARSIAPFPIQVTAADLGDETRMYAAVAAGDLDLDGDLDLVLAKVREPVRVLLNDGEGRFTDAAATVFDGSVPTDAEQIALADMNGDGYLDLLAFQSAYYGGGGGRLYLFDPTAARFRDSGFRFGAGKHSCGGFAVADVNGDGVLDFYVSFGVDWRSSSQSAVLEGDVDEFYLSEKGTWRDRMRTLPAVLADQGYAGMTPLFADADGDGRLDFLLGNDFTDPSFLLLGQKGGGFRLAPAGLLENNTQNSMSFFPVDFDNDGTAELWENGISERFVAGRLAFEKRVSKTDRSLLNRELDELEKQKELGNFTCSAFRNELVGSLCSDILYRERAIRSGDESECEHIVAVSGRVVCRKLARQMHRSGKLRDPMSLKYDIETFPRQLRENVLLRRNPAGVYEQAILGQDEALFTGISWAGFPYDVDNDGWVDLYIGNGMVQRSHDLNRLLINRSGQEGIRLEEQGESWGVDLEDDTRGAVIADFDGDGDGDLVVNNYLADPVYFENRVQGRSISVELRCRGANYYCLGAVVQLRKSDVVQTRWMSLGGVWNVSQPPAVAFGMPGDGPFTAVVRWPNGATSTYADWTPGRRYVVFE